MKTIQISDVVYATVLKGSQAVAQLRLSGFADVAAMMASLLKMLKQKVAGLVVVKLRNVTTGHTFSRQFNLVGA